jgi:hypothetical protein
MSSVFSVPSDDELDHIIPKPSPEVHDDVIEAPAPEAEDEGDVIPAPEEPEPAKPVPEEPEPAKPVSEEPEPANPVPENIITTIFDTPRTLYLGKETTVTDAVWDFGNSVVYCIAPTEDTMIVNKQYVDNAVQGLSDRIESEASNKVNKDINKELQDKAEEITNANNDLKKDLLEKMEELTKTNKNIVQDLESKIEELKKELTKSKAAEADIHTKIDILYNYLFKTTI